MKTYFPQTARTHCDNENAFIRYVEMSDGQYRYHNSAFLALRCSQAPDNLSSRRYAATLNQWLQQFYLCFLRLCSVTIHGPMSEALNTSVTTLFFCRTCYLSVAWIRRLRQEPKTSLALSRWLSSGLLRRVGDDRPHDGGSKHI
jgi:hypothetical protein